ncbi:MAG: hypothetical protein M0D55_02020 [Elusimicrobiota bacterium]|nr:MAG: hypothetical protein M0D55_02020 [Elusimicrobiota bacterium]
MAAFTSSKVPGVSIAVFELKQYILPFSSRTVTPYGMEWVRFHSLNASRPNFLMYA